MENEVYRYVCTTHGMALQCAHIDVYQFQNTSDSCCLLWNLMQVYSYILYNVIVVASDIVWLLQEKTSF